MSTASMILQGIAGEVEAYGILRSAQVARNIHQYNSKVSQENAQREADAILLRGALDERNATIARQDAQFARQVAQFNARRFRTAAGRQQALGRASYASAGVTLDSGSPLEALADSAREIELEALAVEFAGDIAARAKEEEATMALFRSRLAKIDALSVRRAGDQASILSRMAGKETMLGAWISASATALAGWGGSVSTGQNRSSATPRVNTGSLESGASERLL